MKYIEKKSVAPVNPITGSIVDTTNFDNKSSNTYSARVIDEMNTYSTEETFTGQYLIDGKPIYKKTLLIEGIVSNSKKTISFNEDGLLNIIDYDGKYWCNNYIYLLPINYIYVASSSSFNGIRTHWLEGSKYFEINVFGTSFSIDEGYLHIYYTKTTD